MRERDATCKHCGRPIQWIFMDKWRPREPGTGAPHNCEVELECEVCGDPYRGSPWMKTCARCYRKPRPVRGPQKPPEPPRERELLEGELDEDLPFS